MNPRATQARIDQLVADAEKVCGESVSGAFIVTAEPPKDGPADGGPLAGVTKLFAIFKPFVWVFELRERGMKPGLEQARSFALAETDSGWALLSLSRRDKPSRVMNRFVDDDVSSLGGGDVEPKIRVDQEFFYVPADMLDAARANEARRTNPPPYLR